MLWTEVREKFPDQFLLVEEIKSHVENGSKIIDEVAVIDTVPDSEATAMLLKCKDKKIVAHTSNPKLIIILNHHYGFRGRIYEN